jgi:hypothetical protein
MFYRFRIYFNSINPIYKVYEVKSRYLKKKAIKEFIKVNNIKIKDLGLLDIKDITEKEYLEEDIWNKYKE